MRRWLKTLLKVEPPSSLRKLLADYSPLQNISADIRFPDLGTGDKNARRMSCSVVGPTSFSESIESHKILLEIDTQFCRDEWPMDMS